MEACYGGTDVMERSCAVARGIDINSEIRCTVFFSNGRLSPSKDGNQNDRGSLAWPATDKGGMY
jgi:hypothetical protein